MGKAVSEEMQAKVERKVRKKACELAFKVWDCGNKNKEQRQAVVAEIAALLTAEAEISHIDGILARRPALADEPNRVSKIEKAINVAKQVDSLRAELESFNMALKASCQCAEQFKKERDELKKSIDELVVSCEGYIKDREQLRSELTQLRRNVGALYEWIQGNTSLTGKQKEDDLATAKAELAPRNGHTFENLQKMWKDTHIELAKVTAENAALRDVAKALRRVRTLCVIRSESYIPPNTRREVEAIMDDALRTLAEKGVVLDERKD